jgi:glycosyltransferase involved in cell wall biosynthesis
MKGNHFISVIIPSYNSRKTISLCLNSVLNQSYIGAYEVILVDSSNDDTPAFIQLNYPSVKLIHFEEKTDPGTARNTGVDYAKGGILAFVDSDCIASNNWLRKIIRRHEEGYDVVGGSVVNGLPHSLFSWASYIIEFNRWFPTGEVRLESHIPTCNISYNTKVFKRYKGFSRMYPVEDHLFNYTLYEDRIKILFDSNISVVHCHGHNIGSFVKHQIRRGRGAAIIRREIRQFDTFIVDSKFATVTAVPILLVLKGFSNIYKLIRWKLRLILIIPVCFPLVCLGLMSWGVGFVQEVTKGKSG